MEVGKGAAEGPDPLRLGPGRVGVGLAASPGIGLRELEADEVIPGVLGNAPLQGTDGPLRIAILEIDRALEAERSEIVRGGFEDAVHDSPGGHPRACRA